MRTLVIISVLLFFLNGKSFPQFYADSVTPDYIIEFMKIADETTKDFDYEKYVETFNEQENYITDAELESITELYYKCYCENPVSFQKYVGEQYKKWEQQVVDNDKKVKELNPWHKVYVLKNRIAHKYGIPFTEIIGCPAFIRAKFDSSYYSIMSDSESSWSVTKYVFVTEEVIKGDKFFRGGYEFTISYSPNAEAPVPKIEKGKSYFIPITTSVGTEDYNGEIYFGHLREYYGRWVMGKPPKTFPIENEIIMDCEYFGIKDTSWTDFKKYFKDNYLIFE